MPRPHRTLTASVVPSLVAVCVVLLGSPAAALGAPGDQGWRAAWLESVAATALVPGASSTAGLEIGNERPEDLAVTLGLVDVTDDENGCLPQERQSPLEDCGESGDLGGGELSSQLQVVVSHDGATLLRGTLADLAEERSPLVSVPSGGAAVLDLTVTLPGTSTNETMTDRVGFGVEVRAQGGEGAVLGVQLDAGGGQVGVGGAGAGGQGAPGAWAAVAGLLPATGSAVGLGLVSLALALVLGGAALWWGGRRGRRSQIDRPETQRVRG